MIHEDLQKFKEKYADMPSLELKKALKDAWKTPKHTRKEVQEALAVKMVDIVDSFDKLSLTSLKKALVLAWTNKHPDGISKPVRAPSKWHEFIKANREAVKQQHPDATHGAIMKILGAMYAETRQV